MRQIEIFHRRLVEQGPQGALEHLLFLLLRLFAVIYGLGISLRDLTFRLGLRKVFHSRLPVIAVGNLAVGGTGKTPMVDLLIRHAERKGLRVAVVSRGYGGVYSGEVGIVSLGDGLLLSAREAGDEPSLLASRNPQTIVLVAAKRRKALEYIETHECADLIILDDAFQHRQVGRDLNLLLLDARKPFGNQLLLPAGILRETPAAISRADLICLTGAVEGTNPLPLDKPVVRVRSALAEQAVCLRGERRALTDFVGKKVVAFAGIARPERFFDALEGYGIKPLAKLGLGDHAAYDARFIGQLNVAAAEAEVLLTTEKDAVKLRAEDFVLPCFSVGLEVSVDDERALFDRLDHLLEKDIAMPISTELLEILACPKCKKQVTLQQTDGSETIVCSDCRLSYPVRDGIPVMLIDEAISLEG
jgi:tetraacyldisaccharide 4'-kinase